MRIALEGPVQLADLGRINRLLGKLIAASGIDSKNPMITIIGYRRSDLEKMSEIGIHGTEVPDSEKT